MELLAFWQNYVQIIIGETLIKNILALIILKKLFNLKKKNTGALEGVANS